MFRFIVLVALMACALGNPVESQHKQKRTCIIQNSNLSFDVREKYMKNLENIIESHNTKDICSAWKDAANAAEGMFRPIKWSAIEVAYFNGTTTPNHSLHEGYKYLEVCIEDDNTKNLYLLLGKI